MRLAQLQLRAFGHFTDAVLDLGTGSRSLTLVYGPNEAGKSTTLRAISDLRFGIPHNSADGFRHAYPDMRIGGVFVDAQGHSRAFVRLKRRASSLLFQSGGVDGRGVEGEGERNLDGEVAPADVEALLNGGLNRDEYERMFSLDHARLRAGGEALLKGEGDVGAALFEASAGVRSVSAVLEQLNVNARRFFIPGTRGRNAPINELLHTLGEQEALLKRSTIRPAQWADLEERHQQALQRLNDAKAALDSQLQRLMLVKELRAVAPLLGSLDHAAARLIELADARRLPPESGDQRVAAQAALAVAEHQALQAAREVASCRERLAGMRDDPIVLSLAPAIDRLLAAVENVEALRADALTASADVDLASARHAVLQTSVGVMAAPISAVRRTEIDLLRKQAVQAQVALVTQRAMVERAPAPGDDGQGVTPVSPAAVVVLRAALERCHRLESSLSRLEALPAELAEATRQWQAQCQSLGLADASEDTLRTVRPMLDADIDAAIRRLGEAANERAGLLHRISQLDEALVGAQRRCDELLAAGDVVTTQDVRTARQHRDELWRQLRELMGTPSPPDLFAAALADDASRTADRYAEASAQADRLVDELARDAERSTRLQNARYEIQRFNEDRALRLAELERLTRRTDETRVAWSRALVEHGLPPHEPDSLREWQNRWTQAKAGEQRLAGLRQEQELLARQADELADLLRAALRGCGQGEGLETAGWRTLRAMASQVDQMTTRAEHEQLTAEGVRQQQQRQRGDMIRRQQALENTLREAMRQLGPVLAELGLAAIEIPSVAADLAPTAETMLALISTRLEELDELADITRQLDSARHRQRLATTALDGLTRQALVLAERIGESAPAEPRIFADALARRLHAARDAQEQLALLRHSLERAFQNEREQQAVAEQQTALLRALCAAAGVEEVAALPEAEDRSRRLQAAEQESDRAGNQLAAASRRDPSELRGLLQAQDPDALQAEERDGELRVESLEAVLTEARAAEEAARRELQAIDASDVAARAREAIEQAAAGVRHHIAPWIRSRLSHALLAEALRRFRDRAQGPMLKAASVYFMRMTDGNFVRLVSDDQGAGPILLAERQDGSRIHVEVMSEGTRDQLYLALRLAALDLRRQEGVDLPVILDDVLMTSDDGRAALTLQALGEFAQASQVILFTHHRHLLDVARAALPAERLAITTMPSMGG